MTMTVEEILAEVQALSPEEQARLRAALASAEERGAATRPLIAPDVQQMLAGHTADEFLVAPSGTVEERACCSIPGTRAQRTTWTKGRKPGAMCCDLWTRGVPDGHQYPAFRCTS